MSRHRLYLQLAALRPTFLLAAGSGSTVGPAAQAGIQPGDVLLAVNNVSITSVQQLTRLLAGDKPGQNVALLIMRNGHAIFVPLTLH